MSKSNSVVAVFPSHTAAEAAIGALQESNFDMKKLSIIGRDHSTDEHVVGYYNVRRSNERLGPHRRLLGRIMGFSRGFGVLLDSQPGAAACSRAACQLDRQGA